MNHTEKRTSMLRKNIIGSLAVKCWSGLVQLLIVPVTLACLGDYENGLWMAAYSVLVWIDHLDIGLGNGLRNRLAELLAQGDMQEARISVSTAFVMLLLVMMPVAITVVLAVNLINVESLLGINQALSSPIRHVLTVAAMVVSATFVFKLIGNVFMALQLPAVSNLLVVVGQTLALVGTGVLLFTHTSSLMNVALVYTLSPLAVYLVAYPITFRLYRPDLQPSLRNFRLRAVGSLLGIGVQFFIIQMAGLLLFASSNIIISHTFSPAMVTPYQVAYRYLSLTTMLFGVVAMPFWSATTDAYTRGDLQWIRHQEMRMRGLLALLAAILVLMVAFAPHVYRLWVGQDTVVPTTLTVALACYLMIVIYSMAYSYLLNGIGKLRLQLLTTVAAAIVYLPLAWWMGKHWGLTGIVAALCLVNIPGAVLNQMQYSRIISQRAQGLWNK